MPEKMRERREAWDTREELWREYIRSKKDKLLELEDVKNFPDSFDFVLAERKSDIYSHNAEKVQNRQGELEGFTNNTQQEQIHE